MTRRSPRFLVALIALALALGACGDDDNGSAAGTENGALSNDGTPEISVTDASVVLPAGANSAIYLTITNDGDGADRLIDAATDVGDTMLHETREEDGLMTMHHVDFVEVGPGETVEFSPGGLHVMIHDVEPLEAGDTVDFELVFERSGSIAAEAVVRTSDQLIDD